MQVIWQNGDALYGKQSALPGRVENLPQNGNFLGQKVTAMV
jgi:hypothetical protein